MTYTVPAPTHSRAYTQTIYDVMVDSKRKSRSIGTLTDNTTTLTIKGTLSQKNREDYFKFTVSKKASDIGLVLKATGKGATTLSSVSAKNDVGNASVQVLDSKGKVVADSSKYASKVLQANYEKLRTSKMTLDKGTYTLHVKPASGTLASVKTTYAAELVAGTKPTATYETVQLNATASDYTTYNSRGSTALSIIDASETTTSSYTAPSTGTIFDYSA